MTFLVLLLALALEKFSGWRRRIQRDGAWLAWLSLVETCPRCPAAPGWGCCSR